MGAEQLWRAGVWWWQLLRKHQVLPVSKLKVAEISVRGTLLSELLSQEWVHMLDELGFEE